MEAPEPRGPSTRWMCPWHTTMMHRQNVLRAINEGSHRGRQPHHDLVGRMQQRKPRSLASALAPPSSHHVAAPHCTVGARMRVRASHAPVPGAAPRLACTCSGGQRPAPLQGLVTGGARVQGAPRSRRRVHPRSLPGGAGRTRASSCTAFTSFLTIMLSCLRRVQGLYPHHAADDAVVTATRHTHHATPAATTTSSATRTLPHERYPHRDRQLHEHTAETVCAATATAISTTSTMSCRPAAPSGSCTRARRRPTRSAPTQAPRTPSAPTQAPPTRARCPAATLHPPGPPSPPAPLRAQAQAPPTRSASTRPTRARAAPLHPPRLLGSFKRTSTSTTGLLHHAHGYICTRTTLARSRCADIMIT